MNLLKMIADNNRHNNNQVFSTSNTKLKPDNIVSFNLPVNTTCPFAGKCKKYCYGNKGNFNFPNVKKAHSNNLQKSQQNGFIEITNHSILSLPSVSFFRMHSTGDFYNDIYLNKWINIAKQNTEKVFYAYTKSLPLFNGIDLPENFLTIQSEDSINDKLIDTSRTFAKVFLDKKSLSEAVNSGDFLDASNSDLIALTAVALNKNVALLKH